MSNQLSTQGSSALALREMVSYNPETGVFHRLQTSSHAKKGDVAGCLNGKGYLEFNVFGKLYRANRLAWLYVHGVWPNGVVDHKDGNRANNAIANLRDVTNRTNCENRHAPNKNNQLGLLGVRKHKSGKFEARIRIDGALKYLGLYTTPIAAHSAYIDAKRVFHKGNTL